MHLLTSFRRPGAGRNVVREGMEGEGGNALPAAFAET